MPRKHTIPENFDHKEWLQEVKGRLEDFSSDGLWDAWIGVAFTRPAQDMFRIAIGLANFEPKELIREILRRKGGRDGLINAATVENSMGLLYDREQESIGAREQELAEKLARHEATIRERGLAAVIGSDDVELLDGARRLLEGVGISV